MPSWIPFALSVLALLVALGTSGALFLIYAGLEQPTDTWQEQRVSTIEDALSILEDAPQTDLSEIGKLIQEFAGDLDDMEKRLQEGISETKRRESRVRASVRRALERMEEDGEIDPNLFATAEEVLGGNGDTGPAEGVPPVHQNMGGDPLDQPSSVPGLTVRDLMIAHGDV